MSADPLVLLPRGVRLHDDRVRGRPVLLGPERALMLDDIAHAILTEVDNRSRESQIVTRLAARFAAPEAEIAGDVHEFLSDLRDRRLVDLLP
ncbi:MAG: pyrroloquinoline quinone biosynthesis protein PqqD [Rhodobacterales bacterium 65-51]|jgi:pyrroloquinoline quinone biosynthesis protein D|uniref:pyrroloquinoline quinone biosynthesis peptide chaperone PqqD n=1 Tax=uncultured Gemmobacter sp. TaxID=1095917 RepID=UPI000965718E|nr:pyrroloquinoline quinone biosynthesis peptide chaperone PqqD [uncultured Gemmobacter sp.]OJY28284.1 MAG: pyrroloquinoline quinone biosynthesis protein PqqD [Rhodobacterales bacterium 65-51]